jgi:ribosomal protein S18 acetylase RimI-like enzyme
MLYEAFAWRTGEVAEVRSRLDLDEPHLARYLDGWGRRGDAGVVAIDGSGRRVGAAWYRLFTHDEHGFGFVDEHTPEVSLAVRRSARGHRLGETLMRALIANAHEQGHDGLSLSVEEDNHRALAIYTRLGFRQVGRQGNAWTMLHRVDTSS